MLYKFFCRRTSDKFIDGLEQEQISIEYEFGLTINIYGYYLELSSIQQIIDLSELYGCGIILMDMDYFLNSLVLKNEQSNIKLLNHDISEIVAYIEIYDAPRE